MTDLADILDKRRFAEPPEINAIKSYVMEHYQKSVGVAIRPDVIIISVNSSALANTLRLDSQQLIKTCHITKRIIFRIG